MNWSFLQGACLTHPDQASLEGETSQDETWWLEGLLLRTLPRYALAPYAPGGPVVAAPAGQTAAYRDGATGQVFVRQPVNIMAIDILDILISSVSLYCMVWRAEFGWYDPWCQQLAWFWTYVHADSKLSSSCLVLWSLVWHSPVSVDFSFNTAYSWHTGRNWNYFWKFWSSLKYSMNISPNFSSKIDNSALLRVGRFHRKIFSGPSNAFIGKIFGKNILQILRTSYTEGEI